MTERMLDLQAGGADSEPQHPADKRGASEEAISNENLPGRMESGQVSLGCDCHRC